MYMPGGRVKYEICSSNIKLWITANSIFYKQNAHCSCNFFMSELYKACNKQYYYMHWKKKEYD